MKVLVCGGRHFDNKRMLVQALDQIHNEREILLLIQGGQRTEISVGKWIGADWFASEWSRWREIPFVTHPAKWNSQGRAAGPIRNRHMLEDWKPNLVVAFPGGKGTLDMVTQARGRGVQVIEVKP